MGCGCGCEARSFPAHPLCPGAGVLPANRSGSIRQHEMCVLTNTHRPHCQCLPSVMVPSTTCHVPSSPLVPQSGAPIRQLEDAPPKLAPATPFPPPNPAPPPLSLSLKTLGLPSSTLVCRVHG